jgi:GntR family transcriptional regulator
MRAPAIVIHHKLVVTAGLVMDLDVARRLPLYAQVEDVLVSRISSGAWPTGSRLPSENSLIEEFAVSRTTIRLTIQSLIRRGLVEIRRGIGTFVTRPKITQELTELTGPVEAMRALGRHATARVLDRRTVAATDTVARRLALPQGSSVVRIQRVRLADGLPLSFDETYLVKDLGERFWPTIWKPSPSFRYWNRNMVPHYWKPSTNWKPCLRIPSPRRRSEFALATRYF